jgi:Ni/Co efflux regulator RcnB
MRKVILSILLAGVAASPALAQDQGDGRHHHDQQQQQQGNRGDRGQGRQDRQQQNRQAPQQRFNGGNVNAQQYQRQQVQQVQGRGNFGQRFNGGDNVAREQAVQQQQAFERGGRAGFQGQRNEGQRFEGQRQQVQQWQGRNGYAGAYGGQYRNQGSRVASTWNRNWRNDGRHDWRRYRDSHRSIFSLGLYIDPFGYDYRPYDIGYDLPPVYFGQQYWIDPAMYDLPYPPPGATWVRYWNDAVLVDTYSGQIIDVIHGFFF